MAVGRAKRTGINSVAPRTTKEIIRGRVSLTKKWRRRTGKKKHVRGSRGRGRNTKLEVTVTREAIVQAVKGARVLEDTGSKSKNLMEGEDRHVYMVVTLWKTPVAPKPSPLTVKIPLAHSIVTDETDVLLLTRMLASEHGSSHDKTHQHYKELLGTTGAAQHITEVMPLRQLRMEYMEREAKADLANRFDVVLAQDCVVKDLPRLLGNAFYDQPSKRPIAVDLVKKDLKGEIERGLRVTNLHFNMKSNSSHLCKVGLTSHTDDQLVSNIEAAVKKVGQMVLGGWSNVQSVSIRLINSKVVPVYISTEKYSGELKQRRDDRGEAVCGSLSTLPEGVEVVVKPDGTVTLRKIKQQKNDNAAVKQEYEEVKQEDLGLDDEEKEDKENVEEENDTMEEEEEKASKPEKKGKNKKGGKGVAGVKAGKGAKKLVAEKVAKKTNTQKENKGKTKPTQENTKSAQETTKPAQEKTKPTQGKKKPAQKKTNATPEKSAGNKSPGVKAKGNNIKKAKSKAKNAKKTE